MGIKDPHPLAQKASQPKPMADLPLLVRTGRWLLVLALASSTLACSNILDISAIDDAQSPDADAGQDPNDEPPPLPDVPEDLPPDMDTEDIEQADLPDDQDLPEDLTEDLPEDMEECVPSIEFCNGEDDNCDGNIDENLDCRPDLTFGFFKVQVRGDALLISGSIINNGFTTAPPGQTNVFFERVDNQNASGELGAQDHPALASGAQYILPNFELSWQNATEGRWRFNLSIDVGASADESNEDNNVAEAFITFDTNCLDNRPIDCQGADLSDEDFGDYGEGYFQNANLRNAYFEDNEDLSSADLSGADLTGANFSGANLSSVKFNLCTLDRANFSNTDTLSSTEFVRASLVGANFLGSSEFSSVNVTRANLSSARFDDNVDTEGFEWDNTTCPDGTNSNDHNGTCQDHMSARRQ